MSCFRQNTNLVGHVTGVHVMVERGEVGDRASGSRTSIWDLGRGSGEAAAVRETGEAGWPAMRERGHGGACENVGVVVRRHV